MKSEQHQSLLVFLQQEREKRQPDKEKITTVKQQLTTEAKNIVESYHLASQALEPIAQTHLDQTIIPWWNYFIGQGVGAQTVDIINQEVFFRINLSSSIAYPWPSLAFAELADSDPFHYPAQHLIEEAETNTQSLDNLISQKVNNMRQQQWSATFSFSGYEQDGHQIQVDRWPIEGKIWAHAMAHSYDITIAPEVDQDIFNKIHPQVIIQFATLISSGEVWTVLQKEIKDELVNQELEQ